ncbi:MAG: aminoglycoside phosphotransferase family protein [Nocardioidaceae bacterium]
MPLTLPDAVLDFGERGPRWRSFVDALPRVLDDLLAEWELAPTGEVWWGHASVVLPVSRADGGDAVLKVAFPDVETEHEPLVLQHWHGRGAVLLLRADPHRRAVLLERLHRRDLTSLDVLDACEVVAGLYPALHVPAPPQLRSFTDYLGRWREPLAGLPRDAPIPHRMVQQALSLLRELTDDPASTGRVLHHDLHYENVLAADREPWLAIDPQAMSGDPHAEPAPMLWNRWGELGGDVRGGLRRRFHTLVDAAGLDEDRARAWVVVRMVVNAYWAIEDAERAGRPLDAGERDWVTRCVALVKAVQD